MSADLWLLNSCTVKSPAEDHFRNAIQEGRQLGKYIVLAGCAPQAQPKSDYTEVCVIVVCLSVAALLMHLLLSVNCITSWRIIIAQTISNVL